MSLLIRESRYLLDLDDGRRHENKNKPKAMEALATWLLTNTDDAKPRCKRHQTNKKEQEE